MAVILLAIYFIGGVGVIAIYDDADKDGCSVIVIIIIILFVILLMLSGLRSCIS